MITTIETKAGTITIISKFLRNKAARWDSKASIATNYNNHKVTIKLSGKRITFDFWGSIMHPKITKDSENIFALYCFLSDCIIGKDSFENFCDKFGYDEDSRKAFQTYRACATSLGKYDKLTDFDIYDLINQIQEEHEC